MKKIITILAFALAFLHSACGTPPEDAPAPASGPRTGFSGNLSPQGGTITSVQPTTGGGLTGGGTGGAVQLGLLTSCSSTQVLAWNGSAWACAASGSGTVTNVATGTGLTGGPITTTGTLSLSINGGSTQTATSGQAFTSMTAAGILSSSVFVNAAGTGLVLTGSSLSVGLNGNAAQTCGAGTAMTALSATGITTCSSGATLGYATGTGTQNKLTKWNNTGGALVDSSISDNGTAVSTTESVLVGTSVAPLAAGTLGVVTSMTAARANTSNANGPAFQTFRNRGADVATHGAVTNGDELGRWDMIGDDGATSVFITGRIQALVNGTVATNQIPTDIIVKTSATNGSGLLEAWRFKSDQTSLAAGQLDMGTHKIVNLTNGSSAQDAAAFGQISTAVNAAIAGTGNTMAKFTGPNSIGNSSLTDNGSYLQTTEQRIYINTTSTDAYYDLDNTGATAGRRWLLCTANASPATCPASSFSIVDVTGSLATRFKIDYSGNVTIPGATALSSTLGVTGLSTLTGGFTAGAQSDMTSHKIVNLTNGSSAQDAAAFGQISTAVNAAVSGVSGRVGVFNGTNTITGYAGFTSDSSGNLATRSVNITSGGILNANNDVYTSTSNGLNFGYATNASDIGYIGYFGYQAGATQFRDLFIGNGKGAQVAYFTGSTKAVEFNGAATLDSTAHIVGALTEDGSTILGDDATIDTTTIKGFTTLVVSSTNTSLGGTTADSVEFENQSNTTNNLYELYFADHSGGIAAEIAAAYTDQTNHYGALQFVTRGAGGYAERLDIASTGVTTMLGQGLAVGGLYQGQAQDVADVMNSGLIRLNYASYADEGGNVGDLSQAQTTTGNNNGWGFNNSTSTIAYTTTNSLNAPWYPSTITQAGSATFAGKITCTNGAGNCTSAGTSDWRSIMTSVSTGIADLRSTTSTFSVWLQMVSGTNSGAVISIARYNDNEKTAATCPTITATGWTRCSVTKTWSATSYTDNSELRVYIEPRSTTGMYIDGMQPQTGAVPTPYETNGAVGTGPEAYRGSTSPGIGIPNFSTSSPPSGAITQGGWAASLGVGGTKQLPLGGIASDGTVFGHGFYTAANIYAGGFVSSTGSLVSGDEVYFTRAGAITYSGATNTGLLSYDTSGHNLVLAAQYTGGTPHILLAASNSGNAATVVDVASALVTITPGLTVNGATTINSTLSVVGNTIIGGSYIQAATNVYSQAAGATGGYLNTTGLACNFNSNAAGTCKINATGYADGTTQFRDLEVDNGKGASEVVITHVGHINVTGTAITTGDLSACGGTPSVATGSTDVAGRITEGTTATGCTLTFKNTYTNAPFCTCTGETSGVAAVLVGCHATATTLVLENASASNDTYQYICLGQSGGT